MSNEYKTTVPQMHMASNYMQYSNDESYDDISFETYSNSNEDSEHLSYPSQQLVPPYPKREPLYPPQIHPQHSQQHQAQQHQPQQHQPQQQPPQQYQPQQQPPQQYQPQQQPPQQYQPQQQPPQQQPPQQYQPQQYQPQQHQQPQQPQSQLDKLGSNIFSCPSCGDLAVSVCDCPFRDSICPNGHQWYIFNNNNEKRLGVSENHSG
jgi:hypothetical protein